MAGNPFDQFDQAPPAKAGRANPFDQFDAPAESPPPAARRLAATPQELTFGEKLMTALPKGVQDWFSSPSVAGVGLGKGSAAHGLAMGAADPVAGAVQLVANLPGINGAISSEPTLSDLVTGQTAPRNPVNQAIDAKSADYEAARAAQGREGFDAARLIGNLAAPANVVIGAALPVRAATTGGRILQGARSGAVGAAAAPVVGADESFVAEKLMQTGAGAVAGGALTPIAGKIGAALTRRAVRDPAGVAQQADTIMEQGLARLRQEGVDLDAANVARLRGQVEEALRNGRQVDPAALTRQADFEALGMPYLQGQVTRDPSQFAREKNLRGVAGVGEPLDQRMIAQETRMHDLLGREANEAADSLTAGQRVLNALQQVDDAANQRVGEAYAAARDHLGRAAPMDAGTFSSNANLRLDEEMLGSSLPAEARQIINRVTMGEIPLNVNSAVLIDRRLSALQRDAAAQRNSSAAMAIGVLRDALNDAPIGDNVGESAKAAFDAARGLARQRFQSHEAIPALRAAAQGDVAADDVVRRFLVNGKHEELRGLAGVLPPDATQEVRRQFAAILQRAAFGENPGGNAAFSASRYAATLRQLRPKLAAFFSPDEIEQFARIGRVGGYMNSPPAGAPVNTSNTASALMNLAARIPGVPSGIGLVQAARNAAGNQLAVNAALRPQAPNSRANLTPKQLEFLARTLGGGAAGISGAAGTGVGD